MYRRVPHSNLFWVPFHPKNVPPLGRGDFSIGFFVKAEILFFSFALIAFD